MPDYEVIVDLCHPLTHLAPAPKSKFHEYNLESTIDIPIFGPNLQDKESTWLHYRNSFYYLTENFTTVGVALSQQAQEKQEVIPPGRIPAKQTEHVGDNPAKDPNNQTSQSKSYRPVPQTSAEPICYVTMIGSAIRIGNPIQAPKLVSVGGAPAILTGDEVIKSDSMPSGWTRSFSNGIDRQGNQIFTNAGTVNIYKLSWRKTYAIRGVPDGWGLKTDGQPQLYL